MRGSARAALLGTCFGSACLLPPPAPTPISIPAASVTNPAPITPPLECQPGAYVQPSSGEARAPSAVLDPPPGQQLLSDEQGHSLLAIDPHVDPYKVHVPGICLGPGVQYVARVQICVSPEGKVGGVQVLEPSIPLIDEQLPVVIGRWLFHPLLLDGKPSGFCYQLRYRII